MRAVSLVPLFFLELSDIQWRGRTACSKVYLQCSALKFPFLFLLCHSTEVPSRFGLITCLQRVRASQVDALLLAGTQLILQAAHDLEMPHFRLRKAEYKISCLV